MQKAIRRGLEREAMEFAVELMHTSKAFHRDGLQLSWKSICHEDLDHAWQQPPPRLPVRRRITLRHRGRATARASAKPA